MEQKNEWLKNKIKGDLGEAICKAHFEAMGYVMTKIGIENILHSNELYGDKIKTHLQKLPDFLATKNNNSLLIESKYRQSIDYNNIKHELIWSYRNMIFKDKFIKRIKKKLLNNNNDYDNDKFFENNNVIMDNILNELKLDSKNNFSKLDIIFYIVVRKEKSCYIYNSKSPTSLNSIDKINYNEFRDIKNIKNKYLNIIKPTLDEIF